MEVSRELREKLVLVLGNLISRSIDEARNVPYILDQEEEIDVLVRDPALFARLVRDEHRSRTEYSRASLTARFDALGELGQFRELDSFDMSFPGTIEGEVALPPILERVNQMTRTFLVYIGNAVTVFERGSHEFLERFAQVIRDSGWSAGPLTLAVEDLASIENTAEALLRRGEYVQAFSFDRLLGSGVVGGDVVRLPQDYSLARVLIAGAPEDRNSFTSLARFILRASYVSHGSWQDLFAHLAHWLNQKRESAMRPLLVELIGTDAVFSCNLLCESHSALGRMSREERTAAIERSLDRYGPGTETV